jgi:hypothetical protein
VDPDSWQTGKLAIAVLCVIVQTAWEEYLLDKRRILYLASNVLEHLPWCKSTNNVTATSRQKYQEYIYNGVPYMFHICALRNIYIYVTNQQMHADKAYYISIHLLVCYISVTKMVYLETQSIIYIWNQITVQVGVWNYVTNKTNYTCLWARRNAAVVSFLWIILQSSFEQKAETKNIIYKQPNTHFKFQMGLLPSIRLLVLMLECQVHKTNCTLQNFTFWIWMKSGIWGLALIQYNYYTAHILKWT